MISGFTSLDMTSGYCTVTWSYLVHGSDLRGSANRQTIQGDLDTSAWIRLPFSDKPQNLCIQNNAIFVDKCLFFCFSELGPFAYKQEGM